MLDRLQRGHPIDELTAVVTVDEVLACQQAVREVYIDEKLRNYIVELVRATREHDDVLLGGSPRASMALLRTAAGASAVRGHNFVLPDDVKRMAPAVLVASADPAAGKPAAESDGGHGRRGDSGRSRRADDLQRGGPVMRWYLAAAFLLLAALVFQLGCLAYAMYALLALLISSRLLARIWIESLSASRECNRLSAEIGERVAVAVTVANNGRLPVPWVLIEDILPRAALVQRPPRLRRDGPATGRSSMIRGHGRKLLLYQLDFDDARLLPDWPVRAGKRRPVRPAPPLPRGQRAALRDRLSEGHSAGRLRYRLAPADRRSSHQRTGCSKTRRASLACDCTRPAIR